MSQQIRHWKPVIRRGAMLLCCVLGGLAGCATGTNSVDGTATGAAIKYNLPVTGGVLKVDLTLKSCATPITAAPSLAFTPTVEPSPFTEHHHFEISGPALQSFRVRRDVKIDVYEHGAIKSINAAASDRTFAILGNLLKIAGTVMPFLAPDSPPRGLGPCNEQTRKARMRADRIAASITSLRSQIAQGPPSAVKLLQERVDVLAAELARLENGPLRISLSRKLAFREEAITKGGLVQWQWKDLAKWLTVPSNIAPYDDRIGEFKIGFCVVRNGVSNDCNTALAEGYQKALDRADPEKPASIECGKCDKTLVFREPITANIAFVAASTNFHGVRKDAKMADAPYAMAQWGQVTYFPLTAGLGGSKSLALALDPYGRRTSFGWSSGARGEEITGGLAGTAEGVANVINVSRAQELKSMQAEIAELETRQKLNKLELCRAIIEAGGFVCPN